MQTEMKAALGAAILGMLLVQSLVADPTIEQAQQALKEQGSYYGEVTGQKNADTAAAIRRFQIRNGLQVTGKWINKRRFGQKLPSPPLREGQPLPPPKQIPPEGQGNQSAPL